MPFHSIVTANYDYRPFLERMADSVFGQIDQDFEWIIVDDGSVDGSQEVLKRIRERDPKRVRLILQENRGQAASFNVACEDAAGEVVSFLDSDDWWEGGKLAWVREVAKDSSYCLFQHNLELHDGVSSLGRSVRSEFESGDCYQKTLRKNRGGFYLPQFTPTTGLSVRRKALRKALPIPLSFKTCADGFLTRAAFCYGAVYSENRNLGYYRNHGGNAVLDSQQHQSEYYIRNELIPSLNDYYRSKEIPLFYDLKYYDDTMKGPLSWLQRQVTRLVVRNEDWGNRRIYSLEALLREVKPQRVLVVRSDRNGEAMREIRELLSTATIDWALTASAPNTVRESPFIDSIIEVPGEGNLDPGRLSQDFLEALWARKYDLVLYTCVSHGDRSNVRALCEMFNCPWFGYQGRGYLYLEKWDSLRLRRIIS